MSWHDDEGLYQPRIHSRRIRQLYQVAQAKDTPLTVLVDQAILEFVARNQFQPFLDTEKPVPDMACGRSQSP